MTELYMISVQILSLGHLTRGSCLNKLQIFNVLKMDTQNIKYSLMEQIGEGGTSLVYRATLGSDQVALKIFHSETSQEIIEREVQILKVLSHRNLAQMKGYCGSSEMPRWLATELCQKYDLFRFVLDSEVFALPHARYLTRQIIAGLEYMHDAGYAHRDIKLENIIFSLRDYRPILTDYGFSFQLQTATTAKRRDGTLGFMAPELLAKDATIPTKELCSTDLFSLGVVIFAVACGCMPFHYEPSETAFTLQLTTKDAWKRFWSYHHIKHNGKFRNMIEGLLTFIPEERWSIEQLKACEWLNDKTCTEKQFIQAMIQKSQQIERH